MDVATWAVIWTLGFWILNSVSWSLCPATSLCLVNNITAVFIIPVTCINFYVGWGFGTQLSALFNSYVNYTTLHNMYICIFFLGGWGGRKMWVELCTKRRRCHFCLFVVCAIDVACLGSVILICWDSRWTASDAGWMPMRVDVRFKNVAPVQ